MTRSWLISLLISLFVCAMLTIFAPSALAGPELVCWPFDIGTARSLPWGGPGWHDLRPDYDLSHLASDTLGLLSPETPVLMRMETLRRAAIYAEKDPGAAAQLVGQLEARLRSVDAKAKPDALALFDLGYFAEAYRQAVGTPSRPSLVQNVNGYELATRALRLREADPQMEFAAALLAVVTGKRNEAPAHLQKAVAGAEDGSLLARNLVRQARLLRVSARSMAELRAAVNPPRN